MKEFKGTRGEVKINVDNEVGLLIGSEKVAICTLWNHETKEIKLENANLIVDAFKVRQQINCELTELLEQRNEMLAMLEDVVLGIRGEVFMPTSNEIEQLIKKVKDNE